MPKLIVMRDQSGATGKDIYKIESGEIPLDVLMHHFPDGINQDETKIYLGLSLVKITDSAMLEPIKSNITVVMEAKGIELTLFQLIAITLVAAAISYALIPSIPGNMGATKDSPNNKLQSQTNIARPYQAYPLIFGSPRSYPDLTGEALIQYVDNVKIVNQLMSVGVGLFDIDKVRAGETPLANFQDASYTIYEPVNKVVTVPEVTYAFATNEVDGQPLVGAGAVLSTYNLNESGVDLTAYIGTTFVFQVLKDAGSDQLKVDFDSSAVDFLLNVNYNADVSGEGVIGRDGSGTVSSMVLDGGMTFYTITIAKFNGAMAVVGGYTYGTPFVVSNLSAIPVGPIRLAVEMQEIWFNFAFNRGLKKTVSIRVNMQQLDGPNGSPVIGPQQSFLFDFTGDTLEQQFRTFKGVLLSEGYYEFTIARTDVDSNNSNAPDDTKLESVYAINKDQNVELGNITLIDVEMPGTINATSLRENKINIDLTSKLITYDGVNVNYTTTASRRAADALIHLYVDFYGLDPETLNLDELYEIQNRLDLIDPRLATFDFTFDDIDISLNDRMDSILQVMRCVKWLDGDVYRFSRDEEREFESTVISRNDIASDDSREFSMVYNPQLIESFDSVKIEYVDKAINKKAYVFRSLDSLGNVINTIGKNPKTMELAGCKEEFNAINRAELEIRKLIYQRWVLSDTLLPSAMLLDKGDLILYAEQYNNSNNIFDGEIIAVNGNIATTSESIEFDGVSDYIINYTLDDGSKIGPFSILPVINEPFKFQCDDLLQVFLRDSSLGFLIQCGSRYIINTVENLEESQWTVTEKEPQGDSVQVSMINYDKRIYEFD
ncbi:MAG: hypothetical protein COA43_14705 [Robiginitomaculum sp.]|nr:MAG: hypothetical protein COA43_14705 [Robiginitomaculum sp.]